jgi:hypothetical protein
MTYRPGYPTPRYRRVPDPDPAPRELSPADVAAYETYQDRQGVREIAHLIHNDEVRVRQIERLRDTNYHAYIDSCWPAEYSRLTGADKDAKERS